jgi:hypothetical protein
VGSGGEKTPRSTRICGTGCAIFLCLGPHDLWFLSALSLKPPDKNWDGSANAFVLRLRLAGYYGSQQVGNFGHNHCRIKPLDVARLGSQIGDMNNRFRLNHTSDRINDRQLC